MSDLTNIGISFEASEIAKELSERYYFRDVLSFLQFAMSYALSKHLNEIDFETLDSEYESSGLHYNVGSIKKSSLIITVFNSVFPDCKTPYRYIRVLMIYGTFKIKERMEAGTDFWEILSAKRNS
ncbi:MAG: hypothetical protein J6P83_08400 [Bacteroidales bacterium]|nr:hypothetical protein [Bacteroidales bacterium]